MRESQTHSLSFSSADRLTDRLITDVGLTDNNRLTESRLKSLKIIILDSVTRDRVYTDSHSLINYQRIFNGHFRIPLINSLIDIIV